MSRSSMFTRVALAIALLFVAGSFLEAQDEGRDRGRGGRGGGRFGAGFGRTETKVSLVGREEVQKELKVTEAQLGKIEGIVADFREASRDLFSGFGNFRDMSQEERNEAMAKVNQKREKLAADYDKKVDALLEKPQVKRLNEIALQQKGIHGLADAPVAASLKLSEEQVGKIKAIFKADEEAQQKLRNELFGGGGGGGRGREGFAEWQEKREKMDKETETKALAVLSEEQQKQFTALKGEKFELQRRRGAGFGRGGEGRGGGRGGEDRGGGGGQRRRPPVDDA